MKRVILIAFLALASCGKSDKEKAQDFAAACANSSFTLPQCQFLYALAKASSDSNEESQALSGMAMGMAASQSFSTRSR